MLFGRVSRTILLIQNGTGFNGQMKLKKRALWQQTHQMSLVQKYPMSTVKYTAGYFLTLPVFSARGPDHLVQMHGIMVYIKYQQIKISEWLILLEIL